MPPPFSGYAADDRSGWSEYWAEYDRALGPLQASFSEFCAERGAPRCRIASSSTPRRT